MLMGRRKSGRGNSRRKCSTLRESSTRLIAIEARPLLPLNWEGLSRPAALLRGRQSMITFTSSRIRVIVRQMIKRESKSRLSKS